jgi:hypothetical protein
MDRATARHPAMPGKDARMARLAVSSLSVVALGVALIPALLLADGATDDTVKNALVLQRSMQQARFYLQHGSDSKKAVELLEGQLAHVDGNREFLRLLADAYRARIRDLHLAGQPMQAEVFLGRLAVLDPAAASDPNLRPTPEAPRQPANVESPAKAAEPKQASIFPDFGKLFKLGAAKPAVARGVSDEASSAEDPFDVKHRRDLPTAGAKRGQIDQLVAKADDEFQNKHYGQARTYYEQAHRLQPEALAAACRERMAYCVYKEVSDQLNASAVLPAAALADLRQQVETAIALGPTQRKIGQDILTQIELRARNRDTAPTDLRHLGRNTEGWLVSETENFRIFHKQDEAFAERVAAVAERTRLEMSRKWFGSEAPIWTPRCELIVYPTGDEYRNMTGTRPFDSPGHAHINSDKDNEARIVARWLHMRLDIPNMLETVLPHEATHVVLAGRFGAFKVPRWADEGIAVLSEPAYKIQQHRQNLLRCRQEGTLYGLKQLMMMYDYPTEPQRVGAFYAQSVALVDFLSRQRGPVVFTSFVRDGLRDGYDAALQRHYGMGFVQLQEMWNQQVLGSQALAAGN